MLKFKSFVRDLNMRSISSLLIYAFPASGKSTFKSKMMSKGIYVFDTDDLMEPVAHALGMDPTSPEFREWKQNNPLIYENEVAWRLSLVLNPHSIEIVVTNLWSSLPRFCRRLGFTLVAVDLDDTKWEERFSHAQKRLAFASKDQWLKWRAESKKYIHADDSLFNVILDDFTDVEDYVTRMNFNAFGRPRPFVTEIPDTKRAFGRMVRSAIMVRLAFQGRTYIGGGDEVESVDQAAKLGLIAQHYNISRPTSAMTIDTLNESKTIGLDNYDGDGQLKLFAVDLPLVSRASDLVLYVGGTPSDAVKQEDWHMLKFQWQHKRLMVVDPRPFPDGYALPGGVTHRRTPFDGKFPRTKYVLIMDIRRDGTRQTWEDQVAEDNRLMLTWFKKAMNDPNCEGISMKLRPSPKDMGVDGVGYLDLPGGVIFVQPHTFSRSTESRLIWFPDMPGVSRTIGYKWYRRRLNYWNQLRHDEPSWNRKQERALAELAIRVGNMRDIEQVGVNETFVALFSSSNHANDYWLPIELAKKHPSHYILVPNAQAATWWVDGTYGISLKNAVLSDGNRFLDHMYDPNDLTLHGVHFTDVASAVHKLLWKDGRYSLYSEPFAGNHALCKLWFVITPDCHSPWQFIETSLTHHVKYFTAKLREILNHDDSTAHRLRRIVIEQAGGRPIDDPRVNGFFNRPSPLFVSVAGHMINMLFASHFVCVDMNTYLETIRSNVKRRGALTELMITEMHEPLNQRDLWHGYLDWYLAVDVYELTMTELDLPFNRKLADHVRRILGEIYDTPVLRRAMGYHAEKFALSPEGRSLISGNTSLSNTVTTATT